MGLSIHCTGGFINPGWRGHMPLTLVNHSPLKLRIPAHLPICQLTLIPLPEKPSRIYGEDTLRNKYMDDDGGPSYWWRDQVVERLLDGLGQPDLAYRLQERLLERIGVPSDEVLARMEQLVSSRPAGSYGNADDLLEDFVRLEDRKRMKDSILRWSGKSMFPILASATIGSFFVHPFTALHIVIWVLTALAIPATYAAFRSSGDTLANEN
jgi:dCTP deaminase-like